MISQSFLEDFTSKLEFENGRISCFVRALYDARFIVGRDLETGVNKFDLPINSQDQTTQASMSFIGLINYLIILEMIGTIFKNKNIIDDTKRPSGIVLALLHFSNGLSRPAMNAISNLRHGLVHNYGLTSVDPVTPKAMTKYSLVFSQENVVELPLNKWSGKFNDKNENTSTKIGTNSLITLIEETISALQYEIKKGNVECRLKELEEIKARFTVLI